ncbi:DUF7282 domain-containing protein [Haloferacaceae archaeon DSL9]
MIQRHTLGAILMVAFLLLSVGTAGGLVSTNGAAQDAATVEFSDQETDGTTVVVDAVALPEGGFVVIHDSSLLDGAAVESIIGVSDYLEPGEHENVEIALYEGVEGADFDQSELEDDDTLIAMPHLDTNENETFDFVASDGDDDGPSVDADDDPVVDDAAVTVTDEKRIDALTVGELTIEELTVESAMLPWTGDSYEVEDLEAPDEAEIGETIEVSATIANPNDERSVQPVDFRLDGDVVDRQFVQLDGGESDTVTFEIDTEGIDEDEYQHGVFTVDFGEVDTIELVEVDGEQADDEDDSDGADGDNGIDGDDGEDGDDDGDDNGDDTADLASVAFDDQESDGRTVVVDSVTAPDGGYVAIHDSTLEDGDAVGSVIGVSEYLDSGEHDDVEVTLYEGVEGADFDQSELEEDEELVAMPHEETTDNETFDFVASDGDDDGPYLDEDGDPIVDSAEIALTDADDDGEADDGEETDDEDTEDAENGDDENDGEDTENGDGGDEADDDQAAEDDENGDNESEDDASGNGPPEETPGEGPPDETPGEGPPDETPDEGPPESGSDDGEDDANGDDNSSESTGAVAAP